MPPQPTYGRMDLIKAFRAENPDAAHIPDNDIFRAIATEDPDLAKGAIEFQQVASKPERPPTKAGPMSWREAGERYATGGVPGLLYGAATAEPNVQSDLMAERLKGIPEAVTGIPSMLQGLVSSLAPVARTVAGGMGRGPTAKPEDYAEVAKSGKGLAKGMVAPGSATARGGAALLAPETFPAPTHEEFREEARAQGNLIGGAALGRAAGPALSKGLKYIDEAPVRKGYTTLDPATGKPLAPEPPIEIPHGLPAPEIPPGRIAKYSIQTDKIAKGLGLTDDVEGNVLRNGIADVYPDLKFAQKHAPGVRGAVDDPAKFRALLDWSNDRIWKTIIEPEIRQSGPMQNLANLSADVQAQLPEHVRSFYGELVKGKLDPIQTVIDRFKKPGEAIPQVDPMMIHGLAKAIRKELDLAATPMEQGLQRQMPKGEILFELNKVLRDKIYDHVQTTRKVDLRTPARKYGMTANLRGTAADLSTPKGFFEQLFTQYTFPTPRAVAARIGETAGKQLVSDMKELRRGFGTKMTPAEEALVTMPAPPKPKPVSSINGQTVLPPKGSYIQQGPDPDIAPAPEPPPGPTAVIYNWTGKTPKGEAVWPAPTKAGTPTAFGERATPQWTGQPGKPGEFFPGKTGIKREVVGVDPKTGKPIKEVRDYRNQQQLFSIQQSPPPKWQPAIRDTFSLKDLTEMRDEIVRYIARSNPQGKSRLEYIEDVKAIQAEITRRKQARSAGSGG